MVSSIFKERQRTLKENDFISVLGLEISKISKKAKMACKLCKRREGVRIEGLSD